jgi:hypothetical protein
MIISLLLTGTAVAQERSGGDQTLRKAGDIASQPARDVGVDKAQIPPVLQRAVQAPYAMPSNARCTGINASIVELNTVLGPDFGTGAQANENRTGKIGEAVGKTIVNSLIPFRGLVREVSGAAPAERRLNAAISTGIARRGFLRGLAKARGCKGA